MDIGFPLTVDAIRNNIQRVQENIDKAARKVGRSIDEVKLVVVTKTHPVETVRMAIEAGAKYLGENYAEEGVEKKTLLSDQTGIEWHMIGHIQSRKARMIAKHYDFVHSLDSVKLANRLSNFSIEINRTIPVLLECNVSGEESKFGFPIWDENGWESVIPEIEKIISLPGILISGLMTMAPYFDDGELARPIFQKLKRFQAYLMRKFSKTDWHELSMGMSGDYEAAVQEGATIIRVGQAILGYRKYC